MPAEVGANANGILSILMYVGTFALVVILFFIVFRIIRPHLKKHFLKQRGEYNEYNERNNRR